MSKYFDPIAAFGSAQEGDKPLLPYIDATVFDKIDEEEQKKQLSAVFDAITLAGIDYDLQVQNSDIGKQYTLLKGDQVVRTLFMNEQFSDDAIEAMGSR